MDHSVPRHLLVPPPLLRRAPLLAPVRVVSHTRVLPVRRMMVIRLMRNILCHERSMRFDGLRQVDLASSFFSASLSLPPTVAHARPCAGLWHDATRTVCAQDARLLRGTRPLPRLPGPLPGPLPRPAAPARRCAAHVITAFFSVGCNHAPRTNPDTRLVLTQGTTATTAGWR